MEEHMPPVNPLYCFSLSLVSVELGRWGNGNRVADLHSLTKFQEILKCSVCFDFMQSPIYQCHNGHTLCSSCKARVLNKCPSCRQQLGNIRCLALEKMAKSLELHCKYEEFGCPEIIPYHTKLMHEDSCNFRPYSCPWYGCPCSAVGDIPLLVSHLTDYHKAVMLYGCKFLFLTRQSSEGVTVLETLECWSFERS